MKTGRSLVLTAVKPLANYLTEFTFLLFILMRSQLAAGQ